MFGKAHRLRLLCFVMAVAPSALFGACPDSEVLWPEILGTYGELGLSAVIDAGLLPDRLICVEDGAGLDAALERPTCGSVIVLDNGEYEPPSDRWGFFFPWQEDEAGGREAWTSGTCPEGSPLVILARKPVIAAPNPGDRGPGDMTSTSPFREGATAFDGAVLTAPLNLRVDADSGNFYAHIWVAGLQLYGDPSAGRDGDAGFWMTEDRPTRCASCLIYRNLFRRSYGNRGAVRLYHGDGSSIIGNRFIEVGYPGKSGVESYVYPLALFDSSDVRVAWNLFDGIPLEASEGEVDGETDTWASLTEGDLPWRLQGVVSAEKPKNVLYGTHSPTTPRLERKGVCGLRYFRNVVAHSGGMDIKNSLCEPQTDDHPLNAIRIFDNSFVNTGGITLHAGDAWVHIDRNDFIGTTGVRVTNSKASAAGQIRRADTYGYLHDIYVTENLLACGSKGFMMRGGRRYFDAGTKLDPQRDLYNIVVGANWILFNDDQPFDMPEDPFAGAWIRGILGDGTLEVGRFGAALDESERKSVEYGLYLCGNVLGANGGKSESKDDPEHFEICSELDEDQRFQIHPTRDEDMEEGAWGWNASAGDGALYDANAVVTMIEGKRLTPIRLPGTARQTAFRASVGADSPSYESAWQAFCHLGATALYDGPWGGEYGRIGSRAVTSDRMIGPRATESLWSDGATLIHSDTVGACPATTSDGYELEEDRLQTDFSDCPTTLTTAVSPTWTFAEEDLSLWADRFWESLFHPGGARAPGIRGQ